MHLLEVHDACICVYSSSAYRPFVNACIHPSSDQSGTQHFASQTAQAGSRLTDEQESLQLPHQIQAAWALAKLRWPGARNYCYHLIRFSYADFSEAWSLRRSQLEHSNQAKRQRVEPDPADSRGSLGSQGTQSAANEGQGAAEVAASDSTRDSSEIEEPASAAQLSIEMLVDLIEAMSLAQHVPPLQWLKGFWTCAGNCIAETSPAHASRLLRSFGQLQRYEPPAWYSEALIRKVSPTNLQRAGADAQAVVDVLWACTRMQWQISNTKWDGWMNLLCAFAAAQGVSASNCGGSPSASGISGDASPPGAFGSSPEACVDLAWTLGVQHEKRRQAPKLLLSLLERSSGAHMEELGVKQLASLAWGLARQQHSPGALKFFINTCQLYGNVHGSLLFRKSNVYGNDFRKIERGSGVQPQQ